ncbi:TPA: hypothetical protein ACSK7M_002450 [Listeria innocua]|uniref:hypothetical protein n=1 Tax=Listeria TaxID=1637 RepID=UPI00083DB420|nr:MULTISPECIES: hypothetical protein [Listeria]EAE3728434.1 hypothetical protein [Listeria monocytogenes serotype 1/2b]EAC3748342.1 hypothetical protein [Listeria monocytogenes]EAC5124699.1 hypothetical protein [Listeria monocytogenes]EAC5601071.1 hypothetical protein [Listeria monocytogenes]EAC7705845.1 hypothetical protein [Listeria monocytogenes]
MKIILNKCFGGFNLSPIAFLHLCELKGIDVHAYLVDDKDDAFHFKKIDKCHKISNNAFERVWYLKNELPKLVLSLQENWDFLEHVDLDLDGVNRADLDLIKTVEIFGGAANTIYSKLTIVEIPDGNDFIIHEYDGFESVVYGQNLGEA